MGTRSSREQTAKPPEQPVLGWRETRLYEMLHELCTRRIRGFWREMDLGTSVAVFLFGVVILIALSLFVSVRE
ncbi:MAG: hypothetical protein LLG20_16710 [Acidobacteriales bacterium]|nr:hypothetical protein [Terriglobales bacterium]